MKWLAVVVMGLGLIAAANSQDPDTMRTDTQAEIEYGRSFYEQYLRSNYRSHNETYIRRAERILTQLVAALPYKPYPFVMAVVANNEVNATCIMGGYVIVNEGLLAVMPDDNQVAFVLGHEIGHAVHRHSANAIRRTQRDRLFSAIIAGLSQTQMDEESIEIRNRAFSRGNEADADSFGTELYIRAGFDVAKVSESMEILYEKFGKSDSQVPLYAKTHPYLKDRILSIKQRAIKLLEGGLKPVVGTDTPDLSLEKVFGKIPTLATRDCPWFNVTPGCVWNYEVTTSSSKSRYSIHSVGLATVNGTSVARFTMKLATKDVEYQLIADGDHVWRRNQLQVETSPWDTEFIFPDDGQSADAGKWVYKNLGLEDVDTHAGQFKGCLKIEMTEAGGRKLQCWFAPGVGLVKRVNEKAGVTELLVRYATT